MYYTCIIHTCIIIYQEIIIAVFRRYFSAYPIKEPSEKLVCILLYPLDPSLRDYEVKYYIIIQCHTQFTITINLALQVIV